MITQSKKFRLKSGEIVDLISEHDDKVVIMYNGTRLERSSDIIGTLIFPIPENEVKDASSGSASQCGSAEGRKIERTRHRVVTLGDTVCIKFIELDRKAVFTISENNQDITVKELFMVDEGIISNESPLAKALLGEKSGSVVTFRHGDKVIVAQILSFFKKTAGIYQRMREQKEAQKLLEEQRRQNEKLEKGLKKKARAIKTGNTVCVEFLDTKEKKAFKIVEAWLLVSPDAAVKPYRPTSYDSKIITEADPDEDTISETSPLARALLGRTRGEVVHYKVAEQTIEVRIIAFFDDDTWLNKHKN